MAAPAALVSQLGKSGHRSPRCRPGKCCRSAWLPSCACATTREAAEPRDQLSHRVRRGAQQPASGRLLDAPTSGRCPRCERQLLGQRRLRLLFSRAIGTRNLPIRVRAPANTINRCNSAGSKTRHAASRQHRSSRSPSIDRCPNAGDNVQAWAADDPDDDDLTYIQVTCLACKVLGSDDE